MSSLTITKWWLVSASLLFLTPVPGWNCACPNVATCCPVNDKIGCCPYPQATCCPDRQHCCPQGYTCDVQKGSCNRSLIQTEISDPSIPDQDYFWIFPIVLAAGVVSGIIIFMVIWWRSRKVTLQRSEVKLETPDDLGSLGSETEPLHS